MDYRRRWSGVGTTDDGTESAEVLVKPTDGTSETGDVAAVSCRSTFTVRWDRRRGETLSELSLRWQT